MATKLVEWTSQENYPITPGTGTKTVEITIPAETGVSEAGYGYFAMPTTVEVAGDRVLPVCFKDSDLDVFLTPACLIDNVKVRTDAGNIETDRPDVLLTNMDYVLHSHEQDKVKEFWGQSPNGTVNSQTAILSGRDGQVPYKPINLPWSPFITYSTPAEYSTTALTKPSVMREAQLRLPYAYINPSARTLQGNPVLQYPHASIGDMVHKIRFSNVNYCQVNDNMPIVDLDDNYAACDDYTNSTGSDVSFGVTQPLVVDTLNDIDFGIIDLRFEKPEDFDTKQILYVKAPVTIRYQLSSGGGDQEVDRTVNGLYIQESDQQLRVILDSGITVANGVTISNVRIAYRGLASNVTPSIQEPRIVLPVLKNITQQQRDAMVARLNQGISWGFLSFTPHYRFMGQTTHFQDTFQVEPNSLGLLTLTPRMNSLVSTFDGFDSYLWSLYGKTLTDREVIIGDGDAANNEGDVALRNNPSIVSRALHDYSLYKFYENIGLRAKRLDRATRNLSLNQDTGGDLLYTNQIYTSLPVILPLTEDQKTITLDLKQNSQLSAVDARNIYFYSCLLREFRVQKGRAMIM